MSPVDLQLVSKDIELMKVLHKFNCKRLFLIPKRQQLYVNARTNIIYLMLILNKYYDTTTKPLAR